MVKMEPDASRIEKKRSTVITFVCMDSKGSILYVSSNKIVDHTILVAETLAIRKAIVRVIQKKMEQIIV